MNSSEKYPKKLVICLSRFPYPIEKGDKLRAFHQIIDLARSFEIYLICTNSRDISANERSKLELYCKEIHVFKLNRITQIYRLITGVFSQKPFQIHYFTQKRIKTQINLLLDRIQPMHIYCQLIRPAEYVKNYHNCPKTIDLMDALSKGMERRSENAPWFLKFLFREESKRLVLYERKILNYFENASIISYQDKEFILHPKQDQIHVIPNGVDIDYFNNLEENKIKFDLVFIGNMNYPPNVEAAQYIAEKIIPPLKIKFPQITLLISGANPSQKVLKLQNDSVFVTGWIDDIRESYRSAKIFIAPMLSGTGMQNKLLEAMAVGLPCITSSMANNAILAEPEIEILIADDIPTMCLQIERLLNDPELYKQISLAGNEVVKKKYNWSTINQTLAQLFNDKSHLQ